MPVDKSLKRDFAAGESRRGIDGVVAVLNLSEINAVYQAKIRIIIVGYRCIGFYAVFRCVSLTHIFNIIYIVFFRLNDGIAHLFGYDCINYVAQ